ncbi:MAG: oxidoreductase [Verrucomicrobia bacterium]|nr:oxidoreductase [Verrucomicrobiota bacterium]
MPTKPKIGFYWCASCGGCEESVVDLAEDVLMVTAAVDIIFWPCAMDFKKADIEAMPDKSIVATLLNGAIRSSEQEEMAHLLRRKSQVLIAFGSCAHTGGIPGLANQFTCEQIMKYVYEECPTMVNDQKTHPQTHFKDGNRETELPVIRNVVRALDQVVDVDYYIPGCPPTPKLLKEAVLALLSGKLPPKGSVLAPNIAVCQQCKRNDSKPQDISLTEFKRPHQIIADPDICLLAQGLPCLGPATRGGCDAVCIQGNMPCTGCFGPVDNVHDHGAKILSYLASTAAGKEEKDITKTLAGIPDPVGTFYRYGLAKCLLRGKVSQS